LSRVSLVGKRCRRAAPLVLTEGRKKTSMRRLFGGGQGRFGRVLGSQGLEHELSPSQTLSHLSMSGTEVGKIGFDSPFEGLGKAQVRSATHRIS